jgi:hypothetical protein
MKALVDRVLRGTSQAGYRSPKLTGIPPHPRHGRATQTAPPLFFLHSI